MSILYSKDFTTAKKVLTPVGLDLMLQIITGLGVQGLTRLAKQAFAYKYKFISLSPKIKWCMNRSLKIRYLAHACLAHLVRHWTPKPVIICSTRSSPTGGNFFFTVVKSFEYKIAISANFVQTVKNSLADKWLRINRSRPILQFYFNFCLKYFTNGCT